MRDVIIGLVSGLLGWTLMEYIIHYVLGHLPKGKMLISREHLHHHKDIMYFSPLPLKLRGAVPVLSLMFGVFYWAVSLEFAIGFVISISAGWTLYEWLHQDIHVTGPRNGYGRWAAKHHLSHHFVRPDRNHGVTTPLWDLLFGTYQRVDKVAIRRKDAEYLPWIAKAIASPTPPAYAADYEIREPRSAAPQA